MHSGQRSIRCRRGRAIVDPLDPSHQPRTWWSEPNGISIHYVHGKPLGILLAAVRPDEDPPATIPLVVPEIVGPGAQLQPARSGTLYLRTNISDGNLDVAAGKLSIRIKSQ